MLAATNRHLESTSPVRFGNQPGMLRFLDVASDGPRHTVQIVTDPREHAGRLAARLRLLPRPIVVFVHGFNTTVDEALASAARLQSDFGVEAVPFCWPADGGRTGIARYRADKRDALASAVALSRFLDALAAAVITHARAGCTIRLTLLAHSMGCYLVKALTKSSLLGAGRLLFDNIVLAAPDVNAEGHAEWLDRLCFRHRLFVLLNEHDAALAASRAKTGPGQRARLGHWPRQLDARNATYVDLTHAEGVGACHTCFAGEPLGNARLRGFLRAALHGEAAERPLVYVPQRNVYELPPAG
ncbi:MAG: hypothetical protein PWP23_2019 [Candidatus Sumerlaeota bacterium]|nr:hypothetical protein [Candidatus Sumerlaeota bacterium]